MRKFLLILLAACSSPKVIEPAPAPPEPETPYQAKKRIYCACLKSHMKALRALGEENFTACNVHCYDKLPPRTSGSAWQQCVDSCDRGISPAGFEAKLLPECNHLEAVTPLACRY